MREGSWRFILSECPCATFITIRTTRDIPEAQIPENTERIKINGDLRIYNSDCDSVRAIYYF